MSSGARQFSEFQESASRPLEDGIDLTRHPHPVITVVFFARLLSNPLAKNIYLLGLRGNVMVIPRS